MKKILRVLLILTSIYVLVCLLLFAFQEKLIFFPEKLEKDYTFEFGRPYKIVPVQTQDDVILNGILFPAKKNAKGLIFYLHGNAGSLRTWGNVAEAYNYFGYDVYILDYRGYGKSGGTIESQTQLFSDVQAAYDKMKLSYDEKKIVVLGYSIGTGPAAHLAAGNNPKKLILQAPYYSLTCLMKDRFPVVPTSILRYKLETDKFLKHCKMPVVLFHGNNDKVIPHTSSLKLAQHFKTSDSLIILTGQGHNGMSENYQYLEAISRILE
ncbi:MAG TPA: alpha/beta fold hydrolase [Flavobacterium sp.]|jgi:hypothetical protein